jgi:toxin HigB-1
VIKSFGSKEAEKIWNGKVSAKLPGSIQDRALVKLRMLNNTRVLDQLRIPPSNHLEKLGGDLKGFYSIRINDQWRIIFKWTEGNSFEVEIIDYH